MKAVELIKKMYHYAGLSFFIKDDQINNKVINIIYEMIKQIRVCSRAMSYIPSPPMGKPGVFWIASNAGKIIAGMNEGKISKACVIKAADNYKTDLFLATVR